MTTQHPRTLQFLRTASLLALLASPMPSFGATIRVPEDAATIQDGIHAAVDGDVVIVSPGVYTGKGNRNIEFEGRAIEVRSAEGPESVTLDIQGRFDDLARGFRFRGGEPPEAVLDGFTIINGYMSNEESFAPAQSELHEQSGGGVFITAQSSPTIRNLIIQNCHSAYSGGAIEIELNSKPTIEDCVFQACSATVQGGGVSVETSASPTLRRCLVTGNRSDIGGGVAIAGGSPTFYSCTIAGNRGGIGGGIGMVFGSVGTFDRVVIYGNCALVEGNEMRLEIGTEARFKCSLVPEAEIELGLGAITDEGHNLFEESPGFCDAMSCEDVPTTEGDYGVGDESLCLASNSPCEFQIGARGVGGCGNLEPVLNTSWGALKKALGQ